MGVPRRPWRRMQVTTPTDTGTPDSAAVAVPVSPPPLPHPLEFTATGGEYFRIWIVNLALTVITLGLYSPWAKVRRKRYFYEHTMLGGEAFDYRGKPIAILKGRLVAVAVTGVFYGVTHFAPTLI